MSVVALLPVKAIAQAKGRLAQVLTPTERQALVRRMLMHVAGVLRRSADVDRVVLVSPEPWDDLAFDGRFVDSGSDLNGALLDAAASAAGDADIMLVIPGDLPDLDEADVAALVASARAGRLAVAGDVAGTGTNALAFPLIARPHFHFGPGSRAAHLAEGKRIGLDAVLIDRPGLAFDVDDAAALARLEGLRSR